MPARKTSTSARPRSQADLFDTYWQQRPQLIRHAPLIPLLARAIEGLGPQAKTVVDLGCGTGTSLRLLRPLLPSACHLVGVDVSNVQARQARLSSVPVIVADAARLPFATGSVDLVVNRHVIEHVPDDRLLLREIRRILRPDGLLYLETPRRLRGAWFPYRNASGKRVIDPTHVREYGRSAELRQPIADEGLEILSWRDALMPFHVEFVAYRLLRRLGVAERSASRVLDVRLPFVIPVPRYREIQLLARPAG